MGYGAVVVGLRGLGCDQESFGGVTEGLVLEGASSSSVPEGLGFSIRV